MTRNENLLTNLGKEFQANLRAVVQKVLIDRGVPSDSDVVKSVEFTTNSHDAM
jgi:hypothetical protein